MLVMQHHRRSGYRLTVLGALGMRSGGSRRDWDLDLNPGG